jgi:hypothetical protein
MRVAFLLLALSVMGFNSCAQNAVPSPEVQIKTALLSAPEGKRDSATVYGYSEKNEFILLRKGFNELICTADDPSQSSFSVACYHKDLEPFMKRGRELRKQGKSPGEIFEIREQEVKAGKLSMPKAPTSLFVYTAVDSNYNRTTGEIKNGYLRYVVYIPYATAESTGLPLKPSGTAMPWIMHPGTHGAHIMINPPAKQ